MPKYVMSHRLAGRQSQAAREESALALAHVLNTDAFSGLDVVDSQRAGAAAGGRTIVTFEAPTSHVASVVPTLPTDVILEPEILHYKAWHRPVELINVPHDQLHAPADLGESKKKLMVHAESPDGPIGSAQVSVVLRAFTDVIRQQSQTTKASGSATFTHSAFFDRAVLTVVPAGGYWPMLIRGPEAKVSVECPPLPNADKHLGWWHKILGIERFNRRRGQGIRVGVVDTGIAPHPALVHVKDIGAFLGNKSFPDGGMDESTHGTYTSGIIGGRPVKSTSFGGIAPGAQLYSARVFDDKGGATQADIAKAVEALSGEHKVDLINISLGSSTGSEIAKDAIADVMAKGTLCICSAGNTNGPVSYPGAFPETVAVSALGLLGWGPLGSTSAARVPDSLARYGDQNLYHANFSAFGKGINCAGPGVGIISTVPPVEGMPAPYLAMDGTSAASPAVCGALAFVLSQTPAYKAMPRDLTRAQMARQILRHTCRSIGMTAEYQGYGMPVLT